MTTSWRACNSPPIGNGIAERQVDQHVAESLAQLPTACDIGSKKNIKCFKETWTGYKLHIDTADGDIPVTAILTSASMHDSQAAIPLMRLTGERVTYLYDLADSAYCSGVIRKVSRQVCNGLGGNAFALT